MAEENKPKPSLQLRGKMFLYDKPELLAKETHGHLGLSRIERPFDFARQATAIPLTVPEIASAQKNYPIVFSDLENPLPVAVVGMSDQINLFVDDAGRWDEASYIPAYLRRYPFTVASGQADQLAVVIDRAAANISDKPEHPFFQDGKLADNFQSLVDFCAQYDAERLRTENFCSKLKELDLLAVQEAKHTPQDGGQEQTLAKYVSVDSAKLNELDEGTVYELFKNAFLATILAQLFSLENWNRLVERRIRLQSNS